MTIEAIDPVGNLQFTTQGPGIQAMADSFGEPLLPPSTALEGRAMTLRYRTGHVIAHDFGPNGELRWEVLEGSGAGATGEDRVWVMEARPGIFFVDFQKNAAGGREDVALVLDFDTGRSTTAISKLVDVDDEVRSRTDFEAASIDDLTPDQDHQPSSGMVGKRMLYRYSEQDAYEHVYLNPSCFAWQCLRGAEKGLADVDPCKAFSIAPDLYLFHWSERAAVVESVLLVDFREERSLGRMFCWDRRAEAIVRVPFTSRATLLNETTYPDS